MHLIKLYCIVKKFFQRANTNGSLTSRIKDGKIFT